MTVDELIDALAAFDGHLRVRVAQWDLLGFEDIIEVLLHRDTPVDDPWVVIRT